MANKKVKIWGTISIIFALVDLCLVYLWNETSPYKNGFDLKWPIITVFILLPILGTIDLIWLVWSAKNKYWSLFWVLIIITGAYIFYLGSCDFLGIGCYK